MKDLKTIIELWDEHKRTFKARNSRTGWLVTIMTNPHDSLSRYKKVFGYVSGEAKFLGKNGTVSGWDEQIWELVWVKQKEN